MKQLVNGNQQCPETIEELQQQVEVAAAIFHGTSGGFLPMLRRSEACMAIASQGHFQHFL